MFVGYLFKTADGMKYRYLAEEDGIYICKDGITIKKSSIETAYAHVLEGKAYVENNEIEKYLTPIFTRILNY